MWGHISPWFHAEHDVFDVLSDLVGGLQAEQVEVPQQVIVEGQKLEVQLCQCETAWENRENGEEMNN